MSTLLYFKHKHVCFSTTKVLARQTDAETVDVGDAALLLTLVAGSVPTFASHVDDVLETAAIWRQCHQPFSLLGFQLASEHRNEPVCATKRLRQRFENELEHLRATAHRAVPVDKRLALQRRG